ncbi:oligomeric, coiled-coil, peripheral membrane protein [Myotisia sp. PD_48]|nr:oligomeric, coiled-coil, peripheral membrane protein [Myotisia sp. PD_48]
MSLFIYIAHTGEQLHADPVSFASPDALRAWIARNAHIPAQRQILMTARGKSVKPQSLATENEIFVYDRQAVSEQAISQLPTIPSPPVFKPPNPPDLLTDQNDLRAWINLSMARRSWALNLTAQCTDIAKTIEEHHARTTVIRHGVTVALENLKSHVRTLENKFQDSQNWASELLKDHHAALRDWNNALTTLGSFPAKHDFLFLRPSPAPKNGKNRSTGTLQDYIDEDQIKHAASEVSLRSEQFARQLDDLETGVHGLTAKAESLITADEQQPATPESPYVPLEDLETITKKIASDYEHILGLPNTQKSVAVVSRIALNHTKDLLPSMIDLTAELQTSLNHAIRDRNTATKSAASHMQTISSIELRLAKLQSEMLELTIDTGAFDNLYHVFHFPSIYGSMLIEAIRRREWSDKIITDSRTVAEELAVARSEEQRRRRKWAKRMGDFFSLPDVAVPGVEINLQNGKEPEWPQVSRPDVEEFIELLKTKENMSDAIEDLSQLFKDLDAPTRQQRRRAKAFKQGSVFELGRSSFLTRDNDMIRSLQEEKVKLEDRLKGSESRVRRLEDVLHRQTNISRPLSGHFAPDGPMSPASPRLDTISRRSSISSRRMSSNQTQEDRSLIQRIVTLEAELAAERDNITKLQREANLDRQTNADKIEEAQLTKRDLMKNLEAKQREYDEERKYLDFETKKLRTKIEELEDEIDRVMDARDHEKHETHENIETIQRELDDARTKILEDADRLNTLLQDREKLVNDTEQRCIDLTSEKTDLQKQLQGVQDDQKNWIRELQTAYLKMSPGSSAPDDIQELISSISQSSEGQTTRSKRLDETVQRVTSEKAILIEKMAQMEKDASSFDTKLNTEKSRRANLEQQLKETRTKLDTANETLDNERKEVSSLRSRLKIGDAGLEKSNTRIVENEQKITELNKQMRSMEEEKTLLEAGLMAWKQKAQGSEEGKEISRSWFDARGTRASELSSRIHALIEQLSRIFEELGFTIISQGNSMTIQRKSKVSNELSIDESMSASNLAQTLKCPELTEWINSSTEHEESVMFSQFIAALDRLDISSYGDAVIKRVKDIETLARKWQKEARVYRDKYHRAQSDSHDKIAYRSFKEGDLALFLPTRNQEIRSWAAFNVGAPHYFLREQEAHKLQARDWLLARITKAEERVVDLSKSINGVTRGRRSTEISTDGASIEDDNPFALSDGLRWYLLDAVEEKPRAPSTPGLGKSTVASAHIDARGSIRLKRGANVGGATKTLSRSLDSRRNSSASKQSIPIPTLQTAETSETVLASDGDTGAEGPREEAPVFDEVRRDLLSGPSK